MSFVYQHALSPSLLFSSAPNRSLCHPPHSFNLTCLYSGLYCPARAFFLRWEWLDPRSGSSCPSGEAQCWIWNLLTCLWLLYCQSTGTLRPIGLTPACLCTCWALLLESFPSPHCHFYPSTWKIPTEASSPSVNSSWKTLLTPLGLERSPSSVTKGIPLWQLLITPYGTHLFPTTDLKVKNAF